MKLFASKTSPYTRLVLVLAYEVGLRDQLSCVFTNPFDSSPELVAANPLSRVPTLVVDEALTLVDSSIICAYLDELHEGIRFFPPGAARWRALRTAGIAEGVIDATLALRLESLRPEGTRSEAVAQRHLAAIRRGLAVLEAELARLRAEPTIAHITLGCALAYLDLRLASEPWRADHPQLARWYEAWASRPSMIATVHPGASVRSGAPAQPTEE